VARGLGSIQQPVIARMGDSRQAEPDVTESLFMVQAKNHSVIITMHFKAEKTGHKPRNSDLKRTGRVRI
jgi:hypothetical protein